MKPLDKTTPQFWECYKAESPFYTRGKIYKLAQDEAGSFGFTANDGRFDLKSNVVSKFKPSTEKAYNNQLKAVK